MAFWVTSVQIPDTSSSVFTTLNTVFTALAMLLVLVAYYRVPRHAMLLWSKDSERDATSTGMGTPITLESPRYLASVGRTADAARTIAYLRKESTESEVVMHEMAEIEAQTEEESAAQGVGFWQAISARGGGARFGIAFGIFVLQQWGGQNSVG
ncbi:hypothetical protein C0991_006425 [Blastosporella zonata]|nr:hypothetical protein C0991_006425 [Blastosporella zonata]